MMVNDVIAGGQSARTEIRTARKQLYQQIPGWTGRVLFFYVAVAGVADVLENLKDAEQDVQVLAGHEFDHRVVAFDPRARIFRDDLMREEAERLARRLGARLVSSSRSLGWDQTGLLILLPDNCPNNTLPIFWEASREAGYPWTPLLPRP